MVSSHRQPSDVPWHRCRVAVLERGERVDQMTVGNRKSESFAWVHLSGDCLLRSDTCGYQSLRLTGRWKIKRSMLTSETRV